MRAIAEGKEQLPAREKGRNLKRLLEETTPEKEKGNARDEVVFSASGRVFTRDRNSLSPLRVWSRSLFL